MYKQDGGTGGPQARQPEQQPAPARRGFGARIAEFIRELDRGIEVMYGREPARRPADQPSPTELDIQARAGVAYRSPTRVRTSG